MLSLAVNRTKSRRLRLTAVVFRGAEAGGAERPGGWIFGYGAAASLALWRL